MRYIGVTGVQTCALPIFLTIPTLASAQQQVPAGASGRPVDFAIPAQPLQSALDSFIRQTGWQIGYSSALAAGRTSRPVAGAMPPAQALETLLAGTGVDFRMAGTATASLVSRQVSAQPGAEGAAVPAGALMLDPVTVSGS